MGLVRERVDGRVAARYSGPRTKAQFERDIKPLL